MKSVDDLSRFSSLNQLVFVSISARLTTITWDGLTHTTRGSRVTGDVYTQYPTNSHTHMDSRIQHAEVG
jgi:hypothetical protein